MKKHDIGALLSKGPETPSPKASFVIVTMATVGNGYAEKLLPIWKHHAEVTGYQNHIATYLVDDHFSQWRENTMFKPFAIRDAFERYKRPVMWIDVDGVILRRLTTFFNASVSMRVRADTVQENTWSWCGGTIWINDRELLNRWCEESDLAARGSGTFADVEGEQEILAFLINERKSGIFLQMPDDMCWVDYLDEELPGCPRVLHRNASRILWSSRPNAGRRCTLRPTSIPWMIG